MANVLDNDIIVSEFEPQSRYYFCFWTNTLEKDLEFLISLLWVKVTLLFFYKDGFGMRQSSKADMPLNRETKPNIEDLYFVLLFLDRRYMISIIPIK